jgi:hypothetical protein
MYRQDYLFQLYIIVFTFEGTSSHSSIFRFLMKIVKYNKQCTTLYCKYNLFREFKSIKLAHNYLLYKAYQ